ncbi:HAMP domain-containing methyl-accepting chemotaxis protein [Methanospirillum lacunae]|nr:methyl-accepting chemotaxis protein [Methanospirillum lacunae]
MKRKLIGSFLLIALGLFIVGLIGYLGVTTSDACADAIYEDQFLPTYQLEIIAQEISEIRGNSLLYYSTPETRTAILKKNEALIADIDANISEYKSQVVDNEDQELYSALMKSWSTYKNALSTFYNNVDSGDVNAAKVALNSGDLITQKNIIDDTMQKFNQMKLREAKAAYDLSNNNVFLISNEIIVGLFIGIVLSLVLGFLISQSISVPLSKAVYNLKEMSTGHLNTRLKLNRKDEIGELADVMDTWSDGLQFGILDGLKRIAAGDMSVHFPPKDEQDEIAIVFNKLVESISSVVTDINKLIHEAEEGNLRLRGDPTHFTGAYREIIAGINNMLETIMTPTNEALRVCELFSQAKFSTRFNEQIQVKGDLIALKMGLNNVGIEISKAIEEISGQVNSLSASSVEAAASVEEITAGSASLAHSASMVSSQSTSSVQAIEQIHAAMEDLSTSVSTVATKVDSVSRLSQETDIASRQGIEQAAVAENGITTIDGAVHDVEAIILEIKGQMSEIGKIVNIITDIADQTNLLALNAAIEAARAGEAGMGFAVVANEVKTLALESQHSAENIGKIIASLQNQSERAATAMNNATSEVEKGSTAITDTIKFFHTIATQINQISDHMTEVASLSEEEAASVEEVTASFSEIKTLAIESAKEAEQSAAASQEASSALSQVSTIVSNLSVIASRINEATLKLNG